MTKYATPSLSSLALLITFFAVPSLAKDQHSSVNAPAYDWRRRHFEIGESIARLKFQANVSPSSHIRVGAHISLLPPLRVTLNRKDDFDYDGLHEAVSFGIDVNLRFWQGLSLELCPIKGVAIVGNDWTSIFPAWHIAPEIALGRFVLGSQLSAFRESDGDLYYYWVPVTTNLRF